MKKIQGEITGNTPLLMNSAKGMVEDALGIKPKDNVKKQPTEMAKGLTDEAIEKLAYRNSKGNLFVPSTAIKGTLLNACAFKKIGKYSAKPLLAGGVIVEGEELELTDLKGKPIKTYDKDIRTIVNKFSKGRQVKIRPKIREWKLAFTLLYDNDLIGQSENIKAILEEAGQRVGILDFRPQKSGSFGTFKVTKWVEAK